MICSMCIDDRMLMANIFLRFILFGILILKTDAACSDFPSVFDGNWYDSHFQEESSKGMIIFSQNQKKVASGWKLTVNRQEITEFTCVLSSSGLLVFQSPNTIAYFGSNVYVILCLSVTKITDNSYKYHRRGVIIESTLRGYVLYESDSLSSSTSTYCSGSGTSEDFGILVKDGQYGNVGITLPNPFRGRYNYTFTSDGTNYKCAGTSLMDGCTDQTSVKLNTSLCNEQLFDADTGQFYVVAYEQSGSTYYIAVMHADATATYRSTCVAATLTSTGVIASSDPGSCKLGQTSSARTDHSASVLITMTSYDTCYSSSVNSVPSFLYIYVIPNVLILAIKSILH